MDMTRSPLRWYNIVCIELIAFIFHLCRQFRYTGETGGSAGVSEGNFFSRGSVIPTSLHAQLIEIIQPLTLSG